MRLLVVRCLVFVVVQAVILARVNAGALCSTGAGRVRFWLRFDGWRSFVQAVSQSRCTD